MIEFFVRGQPVPKQSYRHSKHGGYQPKRVKDWQELVGWTARSNMIGKELLRGPIAVRLDFVMADNRRRDLDNASKAVLDALQGQVFPDDSAIVDLRLTKRVDKENPGVSVCVERIE